MRKPLKILPRSFTRKTKGFFFNVGDGNINSTKGIIKYLGRYLARAPIAEYKITDITDKEVTFFLTTWLMIKENLHYYAF
ncbi:transposase [Leptotrichia trevisanii]|uniref:transposase n=1 Tax=Leptotrichia trevisanii TaxID=109328 RepID=UPI00155B0241|nr:transposase [Leptotrichia trevisanii]